MRIKMKKIVNGQQGYWSEIKLEHVDEQFIDHPKFGRVRIANCTETETRCGCGEGCFTVTETVMPQEPMLVRAMKLKRAGWEIV